jgi:AbrB family transcriptional regulator (stage V sporulation protein T)
LPGFSPLHKLPKAANNISENKISQINAKGEIYMKATGIVRRIDDLGRVVIPKEIRRTMRIREGDPLEIFTDKDGELIFKKYSPIGELGDFANQICDSLRKSTDGIAAVCDRDNVIAISGGARRELLEKPISKELAEIMDSRSAYLHSTGNALPVTQTDDKYCVSVAAPVISEGDLMGSVLFVSERNRAPGTELEYKLAQTVASFLGKQMEN